MDLKRMIIYPKDIEHITGKSGRSARRVMAAIRRTLGKEKHQYLSVHEFCKYTNPPEAEVLKHLGKHSF